MAKKPMVGASEAAMAKRKKRHPGVTLIKPDHERGIGWRARYREMSFEPYGIGIEYEHARLNKVEPVQYISPGTKVPSDTPAWLGQSIGAVGDWRAEKEYRHRGDFDLRRIPHDKLIVVTYKADQAKLVEEKTGIRTVSILR